MNADTPDDGIIEKDLDDEEEHITTPDQKSQKRLKDNEDLKEALKKAIHSNDKELIKEILEADPDLSRLKIDSAKNIQIIHKACLNNDESIVKLIIDSGADIDI